VEKSTDALLERQRRHARRRDSDIEDAESETETEYWTVTILLKAGRLCDAFVSDNGVGMDQDTIDRVFDRFSPQRRWDEGQGLGLRRLYGAVKQHDGFITRTARDHP